MSKTRTITQPQLSKELSQCQRILKELQNKEEAYAFLEPVDWKGLNIPDYPQIIKKPMDFSTIETKLNSNEYTDASEFAKDMRLVWSNAKTYNAPGSGIHAVALTLSKFWERRFSQVQKGSTGSAVKKGGKLKSVVDSDMKAPESSQEDRLRFTELIKGLNSEQLGYIVETVEKKCPNAIHEDTEDEVEIEVYLIDAVTLQELITYANTRAVK